MNYSMYPDEPVSIVRQQTIAVKPVLSLADPTNGEDPAKIYSKFSRINFTILGDKDGKKEYVSSNIELSMLEEIKSNTFLCKKEEFDRKVHPAAAAAAEASSPAYTVSFVSGNLKGKTPAQVVSEYGDAATGMLNSQYKFLKGNLAKYPGNKAQMEAIADAARLSKEGKLETASSPAAAASADIYPLALKGNIHKEHPEHQGNYFCHETRIIWQFGSNYPVVVSVGNFYAPIEKDEKTGKIKVLTARKLAGSEKRREFRLTSAEWLHVVRMIEKTMWMFELLHASQIFKAVRSSVEYLKSHTGSGKAA